MASTKQQLSGESDASRARGGVRPIHGVESDIGSRIASLIPEGESQNAFARRCGIGETTLRKYLDGAQPSTDRLVAMADMAGVSIEWLAAGRGSRSRLGDRGADGAPLSDRARLATAVRAVEEGLDAIGKKMLPAKKAELICAAYDLLAEGSPQASAQIITFIKLAA